MTKEYYSALALRTAQNSPCQKRKVGCVIVHGEKLGTGYNHIPGSATTACELDDGSTDPRVRHAEDSAIADFGVRHGAIPPGAVAYVTHPPCSACAKQLADVQVSEIVIVEGFMKFDKNKLRYGLIPPSATKGLAEVLTYGAKKYKPNNWKKGDPDRYVDALYRHLEAWRAGERCDEESGLAHLKHALTNVAFLLELEEQEQRNGSKA